MSKTSWIHERWRQAHYTLTTKIFKRHAPLHWHLRDVARTRTDRISQWLLNRQCQHYGPKVRIPELFQRRDLAFFAQSVRIVPPPKVYHDLLDAAARVGALEERIGYVFKDRMTCIEALKMNEFPLYYGGTVHVCGRNNRLALLGDRVLSLALCEIWFQTDHTTKNHHAMSVDTVSRAALAVTGRSLRLHESILSHSDIFKGKDAIAETFEAVLGAIYVDSNYSVQAVKDVIRKYRVADHQYLRTREELIDEESSSTASPIIEKSAHSRKVHPEDAAGEVDDPKSRANIPLKGETKKAHAVESPRQKTRAKIQPKEATKQTLLVGSPIGEDSSAVTVPQPHPQAYLQEREVTSLRLNPKAKQEVQALNAITEGKASSTGRREAAQKALQEHAMLLKQGTRISPLEIFRRIRHEMGRENDKRLVVARQEKAQDRAPKLADGEGHQESIKGQQAPSTTKPPNATSSADENLQNAQVPEALDSKEVQGERHEGKV